MLGLSRRTRNMHATFCKLFFQKVHGQAKNVWSVGLAKTRDFSLASFIFSRVMYRDCLYDLARCVVGIGLGEDTVLCGDLTCMDFVDKVKASCGPVGF